MPEPFELDHGVTAYVLVRAMAVVDARTAPLLRGVVRRILFVEERRFIAVDLTGSAVFGPQGFGPLIGAVKTCRDRGGQLYLIGASPTVVGVLSHDTRGPVECHGSRVGLDRALLGLVSVGAS
jgi:anti-anti-sigma factor